MPVDQPFNVYREQLTSQYHGTALWHPDPVEVLYDCGHISIGDVGYLDDGDFIRMFNVTLPWDDPSNAKHGIPNEFSSLEQGLVRGSQICQTEYYSPHVSKEDNTRNEAERADEARGHTYKCPARSNGALLLLPQGARREDVIHRNPFKDYIRNHVVSWFTWARKKNLDVERMENLILVTGCTLATSWAAAALDDCNTPVDGATISLDAQTFHSGGVQFFWRTICGNVEYHNSSFDSNNEQPLPQNQCVFIRGFRAKRTFFRTRHLQAAAEPLPDDPDSSWEDEIQVTRIPNVSQHRDPLIGILDYIVEKCLEDGTAEDSDTDTIAIAHDDDLQLIEGVETLTADTIEEFLRDRRMPLLVENGAVILRDPRDNELGTSQHSTPAVPVTPQATPTNSHSTPRLAMLLNQNSMSAMNQSSPNIHPNSSASAAANANATLLRAFNTSATQTPPQVGSGGVSAHDPHVLGATPHHGHSHNNSLGKLPQQMPPGVAAQMKQFNEQRGVAQGNQGLIGEDSSGTNAGGIGSQQWSGTLTWQGTDTTRNERKEVHAQVTAITSKSSKSDPLVSTWPKVLSLAPAGPAVSMNELYDWIRKNNPAVMQIQATPGTDRHSYGQLVKLLKDKSCYAIASWEILGKGQHTTNLLITPFMRSLLGVVFPTTGMPELPKPQLPQLDPAVRQTIINMLPAHLRSLPEPQLSQAIVRSGELDAGVGGGLGEGLMNTSWTNRLSVGLGPMGMDGNMGLTEMAGNNGPGAGGFGNLGLGLGVPASGTSFGSLSSGTSLDGGGAPEGGDKDIPE